MRAAFAGILLAVVTFSLLVERSDGWTGNVQRYLRYRGWVRYYYCRSWYRYWYGCHPYWWRYYWRPIYYYVWGCRRGWTHNGDRNCNIAICRPSCANGGSCVRPNVCQCPTTAVGPYCRGLTCSYKKPCYPGECQLDNTCECSTGFRSERDDDGCIIFEEDVFLESSNATLAPHIGNSTVTLANINRHNNVENFRFVLDATNTDATDYIWSNQLVFNYLKFEFESFFVQPVDLPDRPAYVHDGALGVVNSQIAVNVSKIPRDGGVIRDPGSFKTYTCTSFDNANPAEDRAECEIFDEQFRTLIEHGDWLTVTFQTTSGGFQNLINLDNRGSPYETKYYKGLKDSNQVTFKFDRYAPKHCSAGDAYFPGTCPQDAHVLRVEKEFTKDPIRPSWLGWQDDMSGVLEYYVEVFKLSPDPYGRLVEMEPLEPVHNTTVQHTEPIEYPEYRPDEPGMYSILCMVRDAANNSIVTRRFACYDNLSDIEIDDDPNSMLYVASAVAETGYVWQTTEMGGESTFVVQWENHFINRIHADGMFLNSVEEYPTQFEDIKDDGLLFSSKFVNASLDDNEGQRSRAAITNFNGIVKFEMAKEYTESLEEPTSGWNEIRPLAQTTTFTEQLGRGAQVRVWIRATDAMGNVATDNTLVKIDFSPPLISDDTTSGADHGIELNVQGGLYNYTSMISFVASDQESGVHKLGYKIIVHTPNKTDRNVFANTTEAMIGEAGPLCTMVGDTCFIPQQRLELNNCWFLISKPDLETSTATVEVTAYNQALLSTTTRFEVGSVTQLNGMQVYSGPTNIRVTQDKKDGSFKVEWDLPEHPSCYGVADIVIIMAKETADGLQVVGTYVAFSTATSYRIPPQEANTKFKLSLGLRMPGGGTTQDIQESQYITSVEREEAAGGVPVGAIVGIVVGIVVAFAIAFVVFFVLVRRGVIKPAEKARRIRHAVSTRYRKTVYGGAGDGARPRTNKTYAKYDNRQSELYIYGGMDEGPQVWHLDRNDVSFESLIKSGHFANIYQAKLRTGKKPDTVVAKTLKEGFTPQDEMLMKAKLNFSGTVVGDHPNVLRFIGAVVGDDAMGPFIIYEYCENGTIKDYVDKHRGNVTIEVQDNFYRFGLDIAKGMEHLAGKGVVHRRLAARNILLTFLNEVKIAGFGPQPLEEEDAGADQGKKERIPIKWMAPECMASTKDATEKSDIWSYAVVLWEIFSLGDTPFSNVRSRDLPTRIKKGERLQKPENCDDTWYDVMRKCWTYEEAKRPTFTDVRGQLDTMFVASGDDYYYYQR